MLIFKVSFRPRAKLQMGKLFTLTLFQSFSVLPLEGGKTEKRKNRCQKQDEASERLRNEETGEGNGAERVGREEKLKVQVNFVFSSVLTFLTRGKK